MSTYAPPQPNNPRWPGFIVLVILVVVILIALLTNCNSKYEIYEPLTFSQDEIYMVNFDYIYFHKDTIYTDGRLGIINYKCSRNKTKFVDTECGHMYSCPVNFIEIESILMTHTIKHETSCSDKQTE